MCFIIFSPTKAHFEWNSILYNFVSLRSSPKMHHLRDINQYITGHFKSQQKDTFCQGNLHRDKLSKWKTDQNRNWRGHLNISKKSKITFKWWKLKELWPTQVGKFWENAWNQKWPNLNFWASRLIVQGPGVFYTSDEPLSYFMHPLISLFFYFYFYFFKSQNK